METRYFTLNVDIFIAGLDLTNLADGLVVLFGFVPNFFSRRPGDGPLTSSH